MKYICLFSDDLRCYLLDEPAGTVLARGVTDETAIAEGWMDPPDEAAA